MHLIKKSHDFFFPQINYFCIPSFYIHIAIYIICVPIEKSHDLETEKGEWSQACN